MSTAQTDILIYRDRAGGGGPIKKIEESFKKLQSLADLTISCVDQMLKLSVLNSLRWAVDLRY